MTPDISLTERTTRAAQWRFAGSFIGAASQLIVGVVLARLLTPADFGVAALAYVVVGFAQPLGDLGLGNSLVRLIEPTDRVVRTAFTCSSIFSAAVATAMAVAAPAAAAIVNDARVGGVLRLLSAAIAVRGAGAVADALLRRNLDFKRQFVIETIGYVVGFGGVAITLALLGYGVWSLVWGAIVQTAITSALQFGAVRHSIRPLIGAREFRELIGFGGMTALSSCVNYVALNGDYFLIGRWMGATDLGLYARAYTLMNLPHTYAAAIVSSVMFPALAKVQREPPRVRAGFLLATRLIAMIAAPAMAILAVTAPYLLRGIYGPQWTGAIVPLQVLAVAGYFRALYHLGGITAQSVGKVYGEFWRQVTYALAILLGTWVGSRAGLPGVAAGVGLAILYMFVVTGDLALRATHTPLKDYLRVQRQAVATAAATCAVALAVRWLLELTAVGPATIALAVAGAAACPWIVGFLWMLGDPAASPLKAAVPRRTLPIVEALHALGHRPEPAPTHVLVELPRRPAARQAAIRVFSKCRNERLRLPAFLDHYRRLGAGRFFIVDNGSTDGSAEYLAGEEDVELFHTTDRFSEARGGTDWLNGLLRAYGDDAWCVTVDIDELLVYPGSEEAPLAALTEYCDRNGYEALACLLVDLYPTGALRDCVYDAGDDLVAAAPCFDAGGYDRFEADLCPWVLFRGGVRRRVFYANPADRATPPCLTKVPLVKWDRTSEYLDCNHFVSRKTVAVETGVLLHFKFLHDFHERAVREAARGEYYAGASEYRRYATRIEREADITLMHAGSVRFEGSGQLVDLGLMQDSEAWRLQRKRSREKAR